MIDICMALWNKIQWRKCLIIACIITSLGASIFILWVTINYAHETAHKSQHTASHQTKRVTRTATRRISPTIQAQRNGSAPGGNAVKPAKVAASATSSKLVQPAKNGSANKGKISTSVPTPTVVVLPPHPRIKEGKRAAVPATPQSTPDDVSSTATPTPDSTATAQGEQSNPGFVVPGNVSVRGKKGK